MSHGSSRRDILSAVSAGVCVSVAGCAGSDTSPRSTSTDLESESGTPPPTSSPVPFETPVPGECETIDLPTPDPSPEGLLPKQYPDLPERLTADTAEEFAAGFERAYQFNTFLAKYSNNGYESAFVEGGVPDWAIFERGEGYIVGANVVVQFEDTNPPSESATPAPSGYFEYSSWYYVTKRFALREERSEGDLIEGDTPTVEFPRTVACRTSETPTT